uniref:Ion transport domain-containing protein n=1 Tax=Calcidiscus leptoporus TaxID=127549 RepID=A0A7S0P2Y0_9EUKA
MTMLFSLEMLAKVCLLPWRRLRSSRKHSFDLVVTFGACALTADIFNAGAIPSGGSQQLSAESLHRLALSLVHMRLARLLVYVPPFHKVLRTFALLLPSAAQLLSTMSVLLYCFAVLGMACFGGVITTDTSGARISADAAARLAASSFATSHYYPNNFNDLASSIVTLFELLVVNDWQVIASGYTAAVGLQARCFFIAFYVFGVVLTQPS